jgi:uncharacterized membrane protein HdeD (DUF308 family)
MVTGLLAMLSGVLVLVFPGLGIGTLVILLAIGLIFVGIRSIAVVGFSRIPKNLRAVSVIAGIISLILAPIVLLFPGFGALSLIFILGYGLIAYGISRIYMAYELKRTESSLRGLMAAAGVTGIILSIFVLILPGIALLTLTVILSVALFIIGVEILVSGAVGRTWLGDIVKDISDEEKELKKI